MSTDFSFLRHNHCKGVAGDCGLLSFRNEDAILTHRCTYSVNGSGHRYLATLSLNCRPSYTRNNSGPNDSSQVAFKLNAGLLPERNPPRYSKLQEHGLKNRSRGDLTRSECCTAGECSIFHARLPEHGIYKIAKV